MSMRVVVAKCKFRRRDVCVSTGEPGGSAGGRAVVPDGRCQPAIDGGAATVLLSLRQPVLVSAAALLRVMAGCASCCKIIAW